jgi:hypothetical protein
MKQIICLLLATITLTSFLHAQKKNYLSVDGGLTISGMSKRLANSMHASGFGDKIDYNFFFFFFPISGTTDYPTTHNSNGNFKVRYGYNISDKRAIEAGFGSTLENNVSGGDELGGSVNYFRIFSKISTAYAAYMWKNEKQNTAVGIGPAVSICKMRQESQSDYNATTTLSDKTHVLPGAIITAYWNFINKKSWFMGLRTDMTITTPAKVAETKVTNGDNPNFVSTFKTTTAGGFINTISIVGGFRF